MLVGGEDPLYVGSCRKKIFCLINLFWVDITIIVIILWLLARRLVVFASEDVGLADNSALPLVNKSYKLL